MLDTTLCPECGHLAEIQWRAVMDGTDGPVEHAKVLCSQRHWFLLPVASLVRPREHAAGSSAAVAGASAAGAAVEG
jgi:hypothetical protein